ncbi:serine/threonine protein phosphatase PstP [Gordonia hirsuta DSM 44140 = NBRC 16056]|uniref:Serine/threonine protein phosphatase PstP n=1 Tax=Gordonia hirsuta DSM 44140 = NBRC 16056 TaxID=1121927 RepID=L7LCE3_9ACTN|nr:PP2C family serine/threonine-protein phosphatase [Gordonia hirsuta]GAC57708.1 serine/threonine protein phosphatase PstP [Gordonia hirsuta DSM 44140 = NBRC 16056]
MTLVLRYIARSDRGLVRSNNEDSVYAGARLLALADGMGGHAAGEVASQLVIQSLRSLDDDEPGGNLLDALAAATRHGNEAIAAQTERNPELAGMGTTLTAILFAGSKIGLCHIGDSRGYLLRDGELTQITRDDTFVQSLVDEGRISPEQAHSHPQRSLILKALTGQPVEPTLQLREARAGDRYMLCSDGLSDVVSDETIADTMSSIPDHSACADRLIELALRSGAPDNVTVVVADVLDTGYGDSRPILGGAAGADDAAGYSPDPSTAAGRAAALRPPAAPAQRPMLEDPAIETATRSPWRLPLTLIGIVVVIALLVTAFFVVKEKTMSRFYVTTESGEVVVNRGTPDSVLFVHFSESSHRVCVTELATDHPQARLVSASADEDCVPMKLTDLTEGNQTQITNGRVSNIPDLRQVEERVRGFDFLPCAPTPAKEPSNEPTREPNRPGPSDPGSTPPNSESTPLTPKPVDGKTRDCSEN